MSIIYEETDQTITLHTVHTSYQMKLGPGGLLLHTYYGPKISGDMSDGIDWRQRAFSGNPYDLKEVSADTLPLEYPCEGNGDFRHTAFGLRRKNGASGCDLRYTGFEVRPEKYHLEGLPYVHEEEGVTKGETLIVTLEDRNCHIRVELFYGVLPQEDTITRAAKVTNYGTEPLVLQSAASMSLDILSGDWDLIHLEGRHAGERTPERRQITHDEITVGSRRGTSSHQHNPFVILADHGADEDHGYCIAATLLYSGSFACTTGMDPFGMIRLTTGIQPERLDYELAAGESFQTPEAAMVLSETGLAALSHRVHHLVRHCICRGSWKLQRRPVLINNWEAMGMSFDKDRLLAFARQASELGVEMMVLDDGWFGERNDDTAGLGDWIVNEKKLGGTIGEFAREIRGLGMKFGLWIEPEMVNENSELYRRHPDWALVLPDRKPILSRQQLVLDFSREEVVDAVFEQIAGVLDDCQADYVKMDMNRSLADVYSQTMGEQSQGKVLYHYVLGVYRFMEKLLERYPNLLLEGCSGGGGRFDAGMLFYTPQIWCSDNTDAIDRLQIQYGTSFGYPMSSVGAHVSHVPNYDTGRIVPFSTRGIVAMAGSFGYELDLHELSEQEKAEVTEQISDYKKYWALIQDGLYYRLTDVVQNREEAAWIVVSEDKTEALVSVVVLNRRGNSPVRFVRLKGLDARKLYREEKSGKQYCGAALMYTGISIPITLAEYSAFQMHFVASVDE